MFWKVGPQVTVDEGTVPVCLSHVTQGSQVVTAAVTLQMS